MKHHTRAYLRFAKEKHDLDPHELFCEITGLVSRSLDVCHIDPRGIGGNPKGDKDNIENLILMTRTLHDATEGQPRFNEPLIQAHRRWMITGLPLYQSDPDLFKEHFEPIVRKN